MRVLDAAEAREVDAAAIETFGIPGLLLMEHAARAVADAVREWLAPRGRVVVVAGAGNNAGDGYAAARLLQVAAASVRIVSLVEQERLRGDAATNAGIWERLGGTTEDFSEQALDDVGPGDVVVDAIFGTGLRREPEGDFAAAIDAVNHARSRGARVVAVDLPSGLSADTGVPPGAVVQADCTVTFGTLKRGHVLQPGADLSGEVRVADISIPPDALLGIGPPVRLLDKAFVQGLVPRRSADSHKGNYGHCLVIAGSSGKSGAAALAVRGALVGGAGLVSVASRPEVIPQVLGHAMEAMGIALPGDGPLGLTDVDALLEAAQGKAAILAGPGIPRGEETGALVARLLAEAACPVVLDADALNAVAKATDCFLDANTEVVITPHPGEMARLAGIPTAAVQADRIGVAQRFARGHRCTVVLKGARTVIADPDGAVAICPTGNAGMATGGSGDVLGGLVAALLAQGLAAFAAARAGVYVHGLAGDRRAAARGEMGLVAGDILDGIAEVWATWKR
ncbi:NAD(P)H-hydrate dehydratase [Vulgatibacter sp.]|uniref:NAD(P)H-hydrate dehydratase n=1 Tax=Vulgatibacter sp. TaxID=1971226 RepID=UPI00356959DE